jgi:NADPH2:quinone reductase
LVLDGVGGEVARRAFERLAPGGRMLSFGMASGAWADVSEQEAAARGVTLVRAGRPAREHTERALRSGLAPVIGQRFALEEAAAAHAAMEARTALGKTLLVI